LWIIRLSAACQQHGLRYSQFINGVLRLSWIKSKLPWLLSS
jgi:ribosomal protein L20